MGQYSAKYRGKKSLKYVETVKIGAAVFLVMTGAYTDIKYRKVPVMLPLFFLFTGAILNGYLLYTGKTTVVTCILSLSVGVCMLLFAAVFRGSMGYGDGLMTLALGMFLRWEEIFAATCIGIFLMGIGGGVLLALRKADRKTQIPFLPFLAVAFFVTESIIVL